MSTIIYGAGIVGRILLKWCNENDIKVDCFCDNSKKVSESKFCGLNVIHTPDLPKKYKNATFLISTVAIKDVVDLLNELGYTKWIAGGVLLKGFNTISDKYALDTCISCHEGFMDKSKVFLRSVDVIITEKCSLKCKDCSNLMQYYERPIHCDLDSVLNSVNALCDNVDEILEFRVIGGEAFLNKDWSIVVEKLINNPKCKRVVIYTNGTIIPKDISCLKNSKAFVVITDYGKLSRKINDLVDLLNNNNVNFFIIKSPEWIDCATIHFHDRDDGAFKMCCAKNIATLSDGKLYRCPYAANASRLGVVEEDETDYVDVFHTNGRKIREYITRDNGLGACNYCNSRPLYGKEITPAVQIKHSLRYDKHK